MINIYGNHLHNSQARQQPKSLECVANKSINIHATSSKLLHKSAMYDAPVIKLSFLLIDRQFPSPNNLFPGHSTSMLDQLPGAFLEDREPF